MRIVGKQNLDNFCRRHSNARSQISSWIYEVEDADWKTPNDIKARYSSASFLSDNRVIFNIKGNDYRLETKINYKNKLVLIMRIGTHAQYSKWRIK